MTDKIHMKPVANQTCPRARILLLWLGLFVAGALQAQPPVVPEYNLKAGYLIRFVKYITWPTNTFASSNAPIVIAVLGDDPFGEVLDKTVHAEKGGRPMVVRRVDNIAEAAQCHVVFISQAEDGREARWLAALKDQAILTVGESAETLERGGILQFVTEGKRIRFEASLPASHLAGLKLDADLLGYAKKVRRIGKESP